MPDLPSFPSPHPRSALLPSAAPLLAARQLFFRHAGAEPLFSAMDFDIAPGVTLVRGGDGRGKTSLLRLLAGELQPSGGGVSGGGQAADSASAAWQRRVFRVDPRTETFDQMTPPAWFESLRPLHAAFDSQALADAIEGLSLAPHLGKQLFMLSTGSKRKVWLAGAMACGAAVVLLDEPFAALDKPSTVLVLSHLQQVTRSAAQAWVVADYEAPEGVPLAGVIDLGD